MQNRDWHNKPLQGGGRDGFGYGRTDLTPTPDTWWTRFAIPLMLVAGILCWLAVGLLIESLMA